MLQSREDVVPVNHSGSLRWILNTKADTLTLSVIPGDTLYFNMDWKRDGSHYEGWIIPGGVAAHLSFETEFVKWIKGPNELSCSARILVTSFKSYDSKSTGGWASANDIIVNLEVFSAEWDAYGHGSYQSLTESGSW